jgi:hypothetical protein
MSRPADTTTDAWRTQLEVWRAMTGPERVAKAFELTDAARAVTEAGIRHRHPEWSDEHVRDAMFDVLLGVELAAKVRRSRSTILGREVPMATAEDTILAKLEWAVAGESDRQLQDVARILAVSGASLDRAYLGRWVAQLGLDEAFERAQRLAGAEPDS